MLIDAFNEFSSAQAVTSTAISTNVVDLGATNTLKNLGAGESVWLIVRTIVAATDSGSDATLAVTLESDSTADLATSATVHASSGTLAFGTFSPAGTTLLAIRLPAGNYERYLGVRYTVASGPLTAGQFDAFLTKDFGSYRAYADNSTIASNA
jgi:hypothetical protein